MRDLTQGWCERGASFAEALEQIPADTYAWWDEPEWSDPPVDDWRAAVNVWILTGATPSRRDVKGAGDGLADLLVAPEVGSVQPLEVLSTIDPRYKAAVPHAFALINELNGATRPDRLIPVSLGEGWQPPLTRKDRALRARWAAAATRAREEAETGDVSAETIAELRSIFPGLEIGEWVAETEGGGFTLGSWNAAVRPSRGVPYLQRLSDYLSTDAQAVRHVEKLRREAVTLGSDRTHLFLLVASSGRWGDLLPTSPSWFTDGTFVPPAGLTDLWLDGGTGWLMRWRREAGWTYHED